MRQVSKRSQKTEILQKWYMVLDGINYQKSTVPVKTIPLGTVDRKSVTVDTRIHMNWSFWVLLVSKCLILSLIHI